MLSGVRTPDFLLIGNRLCVDYANSVRSVREKADALQDWGDLVRFLSAASVIANRQRPILEELETASPGEARAALAEALMLREAIRECLSARVDGREIHPDWLQPINRVLRLTEGYDQIVPASARGEAQDWRIEFVMRERRLEWLLAAIARSAADLLAEGPAAPIRKCANPACVLYFYDDSRTGRRRWCSMAVCGNRSKVAAHARRARKAKAQGTK